MISVVIPPLRNLEANTAEGRLPPVTLVSLSHKVKMSSSTLMPVKITRGGLFVQVYSHMHTHTH